MKIYENILKGRVKYPPYIHPDAQDLLQQLITPDLTKRLGNLHGGSKDVMQHRWFAEVTWERLAKKDIDAPYVPPVRGGVGDASQFDKYPEETEEYGYHGEDPYVSTIFPILTMSTLILAGTVTCSRNSRREIFRRRRAAESDIDQDGYMQRRSLPSSEVDFANPYSWTCLCLLEGFLASHLHHTLLDPCI